ncbi:hypothetical protein J2TS6_48610 [Paenibacillus albilobatus]|uniref:Uncharacterized protein n=1 Tax=Paenibacillus albilobatus TaxID=2716884 RepID=A0A919XMW1_9BACL|nr:hypothetical protein [Paenibacillus albilobatus]GIO33720.1 hypothetical protein J2TS6_48610 [Paenibacillus albilobatus]
MEETVMRAFEKLQKREHLLRVNRDQMALGRITKEEFKKRETQILERYGLTDSEQRAYDQYLRMAQQKRHR